jgi:hypothetical protein
MPDEEHFFKRDFRAVSDICRMERGDFITTFHSYEECVFRNELK